MLKLFTQANLQIQLPILQQRWTSINNHITDFAIRSYNYTIVLPSSIDLNSTDDIRTSIKQLSRIIQTKYDTLTHALNDKQIRNFVRQRCDDYHDNQKHMIDSFLDRSKRTIIIDRVLQTQDDHQLLVTDPNEIKRLTNEHFQTCAGGVHTPKIIPDQWKDQYKPRHDLLPSIYDNLMSSPSSQEWADVIQQLPLHKASGPSGITNEMLKHLGPNMSETLRKFVAGCLLLNDIPSAWREAYVYPIPKPKEWECNLNNTRPITLLETTRKAMVRLLNNRLAKIFVQHKVLRGNQFAGLPGTSTFEPLRIINEIIEDAKEKHNEIWLLFQDMSKAYDRLNIHMLRHALDRLQIPSQFSTLICNLFTQRKNRVFTAVGTTTPYDVLIGIDQGEVISPLLWCIYYDPLLCEIEKQKLGYTINHSYRQNVYSDSLTSLQHTSSSLAFMDDTTWIASSQQNLESILSIADDFNNLNNILVNKSKSELLVYVPG